MSRPWPRSLVLAVAITVGGLINVLGPVASAQADTFIPVPCGTPGAVGCVSGPPPQHAPLPAIDIALGRSSGHPLA
jgi:hypothetical protein